MTSKLFQEKLDSIFEPDTYLLVSEYIKSNLDVKIKHIGGCNKVFNVIANDLTKEAKRHRFYSSCPMCRKSKNLTIEEIEKRIDISTNNRILLKKYGGNTHSSSLFQCKKCLYEFSLSLHTFLYNRKNTKDKNNFGCARCSNKKHKTTIEFKTELLNKFKGKIILLSEYKNVSTKVKIQCNSCNYIWKTTPSTILQASRCPECQRKTADSKKVKWIIEYFNKNEIPFEREITYDGLKYKKQLYFDFCISTSKGDHLIEFDGSQHFTGWKGQNDLEVIQLRDSIKNDFCKKYKIPLTRLDYKMSKSVIYEILHTIAI